LPNGLGMFRFSTIEEAVEALAAVNKDYPRHRRAARELAETYFDGRRILAGLLDDALSGAGKMICGYLPPEGVSIGAARCSNGDGLNPKKN